MSVQKYVVSQDEIGFTILKNHVLQNFCDLEALGVWVYLASLPPNWTFYKDQLKDHFHIGRERLNRILSILCKHNLIRIENKRDTQGRFVHMSLHVCNGTDFKINAQPLQPAPVVENPNTVHPCTGNPSTANQSLATDTYKDISKKKEGKKERSLIDSATGVAQADPAHGFNDFWKIYPVKKNRVRAKKIWEKKKYSPIVVMILADVMKRSELDSQWHDKQYIPHPSTYLGNELWNDEITTSESKPSKKNTATDSLSRVLKKHMSQGATYDQHGNTYDPLR